MEIKEFIRLEDEVKQILIDNPATRNDDMLLYIMYASKKDINDRNFVCCFYNKKVRQSFNISPFETVSRCRRKIQAQCPELASERAIKKAKKQLEQDFKDYAKL